MKKEHVCDSLNHDGLTSSSCDTIAGSSGEKTLVARCNSLPDIGEDNQNSKEDGDRSTTKDVGDGHNEDICKAEGEHISACE